MKKNILLFGSLLMFSYVFSQVRTLNWNFEEPQITCGETVQNYSPLLVSRVLSDVVVPVVNGTLNYDFKNKQSYIDDPFFSMAFIRQKGVLPGVFVKYAGIGDQSSVADEDTDITTADYLKWLNNGTEIRIYKLVDYNMDGDISALDYNLWQNNSPRFSSVKRE